MCRIIRAGRMRGRRNWLTACICGILIERCRWSVVLVYFLKNETPAGGMYRYVDGFRARMVRGDGGVSDATHPRTVLDRDARFRNHAWPVGDIAGLPIDFKHRLIPKVVRGHEPA